MERYFLDSASLGRKFGASDRAVQAAHNVSGYTNGHVGRRPHFSYVAARIVRECQFGSHYWQHDVGLFPVVIQLYRVHAHAGLRLS